MDDFRDDSLALAGLGSYLAVFNEGFAAAPKMQMDLGVNLSVQAAQYALNLKGFKGKTGQPLVEDGAMGPNTTFALNNFIAAQRKSTPAAQWQQSSPNVLWFTPSTSGQVLSGALNMTDKGRKLLSQTTQPKAAPGPQARNAVTGGNLVAVPGKEVMPIRDAQNILRGLGANIPVDNKWGPATKDAWAWAARKYGRPMDASEIPGDPYRMLVDANAASMLRVKSRETRNPKMVSIQQIRAELKKPAAAPKAAPKPVVKPAAKPATAKKPAAKPVTAKSTTPSRSGLVDVNVGVAQDLLIKLGAKFKRDGLYGPGTAAQWRAAATGRKLAGEFDRSGPMNAWVDPNTLATLTKLAGERIKPAAAAPPSAKPKAPTKAPATKPTAPSRAGLVNVAVKAAQETLIKLGAKMKADGLFGPTTKGQWAAQAKARKLPVEFDRAGPNVAWVDPKTLAALETAARGKVATSTPSQSKAIDDAAKLLIAQATVSMPVKLLQQALLVVNAQGSLKGQIQGVKESGVWDAPTERGFFIFYGLKSPIDAVWAKALPRLLAGNKKSLKVPPNFALKAGEHARVWQDQQKVKNAAKAAAPKPQAKPGTNPPMAGPAGSLWQAAVSRSDTLASVKLVQQALLEIWTLQKEGRIPKTPAIPKVSVTGHWNASTNAPAFWLAWGTQIFGGKNPSNSDKTNYLNRVLANTTLSGFGGFGAVPAAGKGATAIKLPSDVASNAQVLAAQFIARNTGSAPAPKDTATVPLPQGGGTVALDPELIRGQVPVGTPAAQPAQDTSAPPPQELAPAPVPQQGPDILAPYQGPITQEPTAQQPQQPQWVPQQADVNITLPQQPATDETLSPPGAAPAPEPAPAPASSGGIGLVLGLIAVGTLTVVAMNKKDKPGSAIKTKAPARKTARR